MNVIFKRNQETLKAHRSILWKIYFWVISFVLIFGITLAAIIEGINLLFILDVSIGFVAITGMYGYVYQKQIGKEKFWKQYFAFMVVWELLYSITYESFINYPNAIHEGYVVNLAISYCLAIPILLSLYRYSYCSTEFWSKQEQP